MIASHPSPAASTTALRQGIRAARLGVVAKVVMAAIKLAAGLAGNAYDLVADAAESMVDTVSSLIGLSGLRIASREPREQSTYGYGRANALAATAVAFMLIRAAVGIA